MEAPIGGARAGGVLAAVLVAVGFAAGPEGMPPPAAGGCPAPREVQARSGHSLVVRCDGDGRHAVQGPARLLFALPIDLNRADAATLAALPGLGPGRAEAIVRTRSLRPFQSVSDLARVPGIGEGTITRVAHRVVAIPVESLPNPEKTHGLSPDGR